MDQKRSLALICKLPVCHCEPTFSSAESRAAMGHKRKSSTMHACGFVALCT